MSGMRAKVGTNGRLVIPAALRREVGLKEGGTVLLETSDGELRVRPLGNVVDAAQAKVKKYLKDSGSLAGELIADRHMDAKRGG